MSSQFTTQDCRDFSRARMDGRARDALRILHKVAGVEYVDHSFERAGLHCPASPQGGSPLWDVSANGVYPEDIYSKEGLRYYSTGDKYLDEQAYSVIRAADGLVAAKVTVYRAVEADASERILPGDWVTPVKQYAQDHADGHITGPSKIITASVFSRDLFTDGNSWLEWGYHPQGPLPRLIPGVLTLPETLAGVLDKRNHLYAQLSATQREQLCANEGFVQSMNVEAKYLLGLNDAAPVLQHLRESGQFEAELACVSKSDLPVHLVSPELAHALQSHSQEVAKVGAALIWQQNTAHLGEDMQMHQVLAQLSPAPVNAMILRAMPQALALYDLDIGSPKLEHSAQLDRS